MSSTKGDAQKEAYLLAGLALLLASYKIWRFWSESEPISKLAYSSGLAASFFAVYTAVTYNKQ